MSKKYKFSIMFIITVIFIIICSTKVNAVSANLSASSTNVEVGESVTITTSIHGAAWDVNVSGAVSDAYADNTDDANNKTIKKTTTFTPNLPGEYTIILKNCSIIIHGLMLMRLKSI